MLNSLSMIEEAGSNLDGTKLRTVWDGRWLVYRLQGVLIYSIDSEASSN
jgi:hypothetical protein